MNDHTQRPFSAETLLAHAGVDPRRNRGYVNTPVYRGSTIVFPTLAALESADHRLDYGRYWSPTSVAVEDTVTRLEQAAGTVLAPSGLSALALAFMAVLRAGDDVLLTDSAYQPTRRFADGILKQMDVSVRYYDPRIGSGIGELLTDRTRAIFVESPGSLTFEVQDLPAIAEASKGRDVAIVADNSWATPLFHRPLTLGADLVVHSATKMFGGHSDILLGTVSANARWLQPLLDAHLRLGLRASADDCFLMARGMRTLAIRMKEQGARSTEMARWLESQPGVVRVIHPALPSHPDHAIYARDFSGSGSLFSFVLEQRSHDDLARMVDGLRLFGMGYSWGGFESLCLPIRRDRRAVTPWPDDGQMIRLHVGLESLDDLKADLAEGLARYRAG